MTPSKLAATLYTLRAYTKAPWDIARTLKKVRSIGYESVQLSGLGPIDPNELKTILDGEGLSVCATHVSYERLEKELDVVVEEHRLWGCRHIAIGSLPEAYREDDGFSRFAKEAHEIAGQLKKAGMTFSYHNHNWELERIDGRTGLDILVEESDPSLCFEIDTYWIQAGGGDPASWIRRVKGRAPLVHLKDMTVSERKPVMAEVGEGNLNWDGILEACSESKVEWYIVEQDWCERDPFESIAISLRNLKGMGLA